MRNHLFIDSLNALAADLETNLFHLFTRNRKLSDQLDTLAMHLLDFKTALYQNLSILIGDCLTQNNAQNLSFLSQALERLTQEISVNKDRLCRYRLHKILKNKAEKKRKESILASFLSSTPNEQLTDLQKSIVMIENDLGIERENEQNQKLAITRIISKSLLLGIDSTPISKIKAVDYSFISEAGSVEIDFASSQLSQLSLAKQTDLQNEKQLQSAQKTVHLSKKVNPLKKKKPILGKSDVREGLLGNLLEETYSQYLEKV